MFIHLFCQSTPFMPEFVYGRLPHQEEYSLVDKETARKQKQALDCSTWGEYAELVGLEWEAFVEGWEESVERASGEEVNPDTPIDFREIKGVYYVGDLIKDPRAAAYEKLPQEVDYSGDPMLSEHVKMGGGSPGLNIDVVTSDASEAFNRLEAFLHENGYQEFSIKQDEALVRDTYDL